MRKKQYLGLDALDKANSLLDLGVPMTVVYTELGLRDIWSYGSLVELLRADRKGKQSTTRPAWLKTTPVLQAAPESWYYVGRFPNGQWIQQ